jgi:hypothetical protein
MRLRSTTSSVSLFEWRVFEATPTVDTVLILIGSLFTLIVGVASAVSETHETVTIGNPPRATRRITRSGWIAIACLCAGAIVTVYAGIRQSHDSDEEKERARQTLAEAKMTNEETLKIKGDTEQLAINIWRAQHPFGDITGFVKVTLDMPEDKHLPGLASWLGRVSAVYGKMKSSGQPLPREVLGSDVYGQEYVLIQRTPPENWDLAPSGPSEAFVDQLLFHPFYFVMVSGDDSTTHLLAPSITFQAECDDVKVYFNSDTKTPVSIEGDAEGKGNFNPIAGQITNWVDFYGMTLIARIRITDSPDQQALDLTRFNIFAFDTSSNSWHAHAQFPPPDSGKTFYDRPGSLTVKPADWETLGSVPNDYPGPRKPEYGPLERLQ